MTYSQVSTTTTSSANDYNPRKNEELVFHTSNWNHHRAFVIVRPFLVEISKQYLDNQTYSEFGTDLAKLISHIDHTRHIFSLASFDPHFRTQFFYEWTWCFPQFSDLLG